MNEKDLLLRKIKSVDFVIWELHIFLDTHPNNTDALALHEKYSKKRDVLVAEYEQKYGPLTMSSVTSDTKWQWVSDPWPWDYIKEEPSNVDL
jgi:spore coat protein JB